MSSPCAHNFGNLFRSSLCSLEDPSLPAQLQHAEQIVQVSYLNLEMLAPKEAPVTPELTDLAAALPAGEVSSQQQQALCPCSPPCRTGAAKINRSDFILRAFQRAFRAEKRSRAAPRFEETVAE